MWSFNDVLLNFWNSVLLRLYIYYFLIQIDCPCCVFFTEAKLNVESKKQVYKGQIINKCRVKDNIRLAKSVYWSETLHFRLKKLILDRQYNNYLFLYWVLIPDFNGLETLLFWKPLVFVYFSVILRTLNFWKLRQNII